MAGRVSGTRSALLATVVVLAWLLQVAGCSQEDEAPAASAAGLEIHDPFVPAPAADVAALYLVVQDTSGQGDRLLGASAARFARAMLHQTRREGDRVRMVSAGDGLAVPPGGRLELAPGGNHVMLMGLDGRIAPGDRLAVELEFEGAGRVVVEAPVIPYSEVERR